MAVRDILRMGDPFLQRKCDPVDRFDCDELNRLIEDMIDTMRAADGAGIAANQIGVALRVVIFELNHNPRYPNEEPIPLTVLVNPELTVLSLETEEAWEGCLSVPGFRGRVPRYTELEYRAFDPLGNRLKRKVSGFHARVVQHECDHLDGILYPQRILDLKSFGFIEELTRSGALDTGALPCEGIQNN